MCWSIGLEVLVDKPVLVGVDLFHVYMCVYTIVGCIHRKTISGKYTYIYIYLYINIFIYKQIFGIYELIPLYILTLHTMETPSVQETPA
jgi:surface polysaccharide O-acyltransferase-like enzyme